MLLFWMVGTVRRGYFCFHHQENGMQILLTRYSGCSLLLADG